jgi:hypothetical protein
MILPDSSGSIGLAENPALDPPHLLIGRFLRGAVAKQHVEHPE